MEWLSNIVGTTIDSYRVDAVIGKGAMGAVFRGHHTGLKRDVAIKLLHPTIGSNETSSKRFDREAMSLSRLDHPNCVRVSDFGTTQTGAKYLVMEFLKGGELDIEPGKPWAVADAVAVAKQMFAGLEHVHSHDVVHRDLKPENVFVTRDDRGQRVVKLIDFGIAKLIDGEGAQEMLTRADTVLGTPRYMSPEQAAGGKIDARTDLYAAGLILYEMLAGRPPFDADEPGQLLGMRIMTRPGPLPAGLPDKLVALVYKLLEALKADRCKSASEVLQVLDSVERELVEAPVTVTPTAAPSLPLASPLPVVAVTPSDAPLPPAPPLPVVTVTPSDVPLPLPPAPPLPVVTVTPTRPAPSVPPFITVTPTAAPPPALRQPDPLPEVASTNKPGDGRDDGESRAGGGHPSATNSRTAVFGRRPPKRRPIAAAGASWAAAFGADVRSAVVAYPVLLMLALLGIGPDALMDKATHMPVLDFSRVDFRHEPRHRDLPEIHSEELDVEPIIVYGDSPGPEVHDDQKRVPKKRVPKKAKPRKAPLPGVNVPHEGEQVLATSAEGVVSLEGVDDVVESVADAIRPPAEEGTNSVALAADTFREREPQRATDIWLELSNLPVESVAAPQRATDLWLELSNLPVESAPQGIQDLTP